MLADRHYMQRGSGSNVVLGEADGLYDAAAACLAVGLLAKDSLIVRIFEVFNASESVA